MIVFNVVRVPEVLDTEAEYPQMEGRLVDDENKEKEKDKRTAYLSMNYEQLEELCLREV